jgi:hypothetical protein
VKYLDKRDEVVRREREIETFKTQGESLERQWVKMGKKVGLFINGGDQEIECEIQKFCYKCEGVSKKRAET